MKFPIEILPNKKYKIISCDISNQYLIRYTNTSNIEEMLDENTEFIKQGYICTPSEQAQDLSTSMLGVFKIPHTKIELTEVGKNKYNFYCDPDISIDIPITDKDFVLNNNRHYWTISVLKINDQKAEYFKNDSQFEALCRVCHTPMKWNYWHFSIRWFLTSENCWWHELSDTEKRKGWIKKKLAHEARSLIAMYARIENPTFQFLSTDCYTK